MSLRQAAAPVGVSEEIHAAQRAAVEGRRGEAVLAAHNCLESELARLRCAIEAAERVAPTTSAGTRQQVMDVHVAQAAEVLGALCTTFDTCLRLFYPSTKMATSKGLSTIAALYVSQGAAEVAAPERLKRFLTQFCENLNDSGVTCLPTAAALSYAKAVSHLDPAEAAAVLDAALRAIGQRFPCPPTASVGTEDVKHAETSGISPVLGSDSVRERMTCIAVLGTAVVPSCSVDQPSSSPAMQLAMEVVRQRLSLPLTHKSMPNEMPSDGYVEENRDLLLRFLPKQMVCRLSVLERTSQASRQCVQARLAARDGNRVSNGTDIHGMHCISGGFTTSEVSTAECLNQVPEGQLVSFSSLAKRVVRGDIGVSVLREELHRRLRAMGSQSGGTFSLGTSAVLVLLVIYVTLRLWWRSRTGTGRASGRTRSGWWRLLPFSLFRGPAAPQMLLL